MSSEIRNRDHASHTLAHCMLMQDLSNAVGEAITLHPEYDLSSLIGRAEMEAFICARITRILLERGRTLPK